MGVKLIPGTKGFLASEDGVIYSPDYVKRNEYTNSEGYKRCSVLTESGKWVTYGVHRLVALAHIPYNDILDKLHVNHINGDPGYNHVCNLEWVSVAQNNIHAALLRGSKDKPSIIMKNKEGNYEYISNIYKAAKIFSCDIDLIWDKIKDASDIEGCYLFYNSRHNKLPKQLHKLNFIGQRGKNGKISKKQIKIKDILTGEIQVFNSIKEASDKHNVSPSHIFQCISKDQKSKLFKRNYLIVEGEDDFPDLNQEKYEKLLHPTGRSVIAYNEDAKQIHIYDSASSFIRENGLSKKTVTVNLKKNKLRKVRSWWFLYLNDENTKRIKDIISVQTSNV